MESKSHWIFDYMKSNYKDNNAPHSFIPKQQEPQKKDKKQHAELLPTKQFKGSFKNDEKKKYISFSQARSYIGEGASLEEPSKVTHKQAYTEKKENPKRKSIDTFNQSDKEAIERLIEEEFNNIDRNLDELRLYSEKATRDNTVDQNDEIREAVLDEILTIEKKTNEIRVILQKNF
jgi:hypothetical protein